MTLPNPTMSDSDYLRKLVLVTERIYEAMEQLTDLYPCKDAFVRNRVKSVTEITLGEAFRMASFCADSFVDSLNAKQTVGDDSTEGNKNDAIRNS